MTSMSMLINPEQPREVALVVNVRSRSGSVASQAARDELERQGVRVRRSQLVRTGRQLTDAVRGAIAAGLKTIVVGGGDGTLSAVVDLLANRADLTLGLLPTGTGNEVARILGIPMDLPRACGVIARGRVVDVDLAAANGDYFVHTALVGYPARANNMVPAWLKLRLGKMAYLYSFLVALLGARPFRATIRAGSARWEGDTIVVVVGNTRFHPPARVVLPRTRVLEGRLLVYTPRDTRLTTMVHLLYSLWILRQAHPSSLVLLSGDEVSITTDRAQEVDLDGEFAHLTPVKLRLARGALRMLVP